MICVLFVICIYVRAPWENSSCELNGLPYEFINNNNNKKKKKVTNLGHLPPVGHQRIGLFYIQ